MQKLKKKSQIALYGCAGLGLNMLNIIVGTYLCSALIADGFESNVESWTYANKNLVIAGIWAVLVFAIKIFDGIVDIPLSSFTDNLRTKWGRRRPAILIGLIPLLVSYVLFLVPLQDGATVMNTVWFGILLAIYYASYTLTMITYYATFAEIVETESERVFLSNIKSVCDVVYFSLGFALLPAFVSMGINVRVIALIFLPLAATMLIPMFLIKEESTVDGVKHPEGYLPEQRVGFAKSLIYSFKIKHFIFWMCTHAVLNTGLQLFLGGINEYFSTTNLNMTFVMASSFAPVPLTLLIYNKLVKKKGLKFAYQYVILMFALGMSLMYVCRMLDESIMLYVAILCGIIVSFAIGAFFSVSYTVPSHLAAEENKKSGICASSMYFAVQGLFEGISAGTATGLILVYLKTAELVRYMTLIVTGFCLIAFVLAFLLPKSIALIGKQKSDNE